MKLRKQDKNDYSHPTNKKLQKLKNCQIYDTFQIQVLKPDWKPPETQKFLKFQNFSEA